MVIWRDLLLGEQAAHLAGDLDGAAAVLQRLVRVHLDADLRLGLRPGRW